MLGVIDNNCNRVIKGYLEKNTNTNTINKITTTTTTPHLLWSASTSRWGGPTRSNRMGAKRPEKIGQGASLAENLIANREIMHPWCRREAVDPRPSPGLNAMMPRTTASHPNLNNHLTNRSSNNNNNNNRASSGRVFGTPFMGNKFKLNFYLF